MYRKKRGNKDCANSHRFYSRICEWVDDEGGSSEEGVTLRDCLQWAALTKRTKVGRDSVIIISSFNTPKHTFGIHTAFQGLNSRKKENGKDPQKVFFWPYHLVMGPGLSSSTFSAEG